MNVKPYLSVVAAARNDDHGRNLLGRMQVFIDAWINQAKRHNLPSELILVEWNPPQDRKRLAASLRWPSDTGPCRVRIIEVPPEVHARFQHPSALPLYQMIAKNVGMRRARGEFILATNIDVVFSDELMQFLAARRLEKDRMYRMDRTDVMSDVPGDGSLDEQLAYCRDHVIRLFAREGVFPLTEDGLRKNEENDITPEGSQIHFGDGWFPVESWDGRERFRWIGKEAEIIAQVPAGGAVLEMELESGPGIQRTPATIQVTDRNGERVATFRVAGRSTVALVVPPAPKGERQVFRLKIPEGGLPVTNDHRILNFRFFRCDWAHPKNVSASPVPLGTAQARPTLGRLVAALKSKGGIGAILGKAPGEIRKALRLLRRRGEDVFEAGLEFWTGPGWSYLENNGVERFRWVGRKAQLTLRICDDTRNLGLLMEPGPSAGYKPFVLVLRTVSGAEIARASIQGLTYLEFPVPASRRDLITLHSAAEGGGEPVGKDGRDLHFRVLACCTGVGRRSADPNATPAGLEKWATFTLQGEAPKIGVIDWTPTRREIAEMGRPEFLHTYACGDFTLMSRELWNEVRGYAELDQFSMHLDSLLCYTAIYAGAKEEMLPAPMRVYHIEHEVASGWTPEGQERYLAGVIRRGIPLLSHQDVLWFINNVRTFHAPIIFNTENWGMADLEFAETEPSQALQALRSGV